MASAMGQIVGGIVPLIYFFRKNSSSLQIRKPKWDGRALLRACTNGVSELMSNISMSIVGMLYNAQLMRYAGEDGVAAYGTIMYVDFIFPSHFYRLRNRCGPGNQLPLRRPEIKKELNNLLKRERCSDCDSVPWRCCFPRN